MKFKKTIITTAAVLMMGASGVAGATVATFSDHVAGLNQSNTIKAEQVKENYELYEQKELRDGLLYELETYSESYFNQKAQEYKDKRNSETQQEYEAAKSQVKTHIDNLFEQ